MTTSSLPHDAAAAAAAASIATTNMTTTNTSSNNTNTGHGDHGGHGATTTKRYDGTIQPFPFFRMIRQRQRWGDKQHRPHSNFTDTFFDLFYVAAAYNLGNILKYDPTRTGLLYFASCFLPLQLLWNAKLYHESRYYHDEPDVIHTIYEHANVLVLATAVLYIRPVSILSKPTEHIDMFIFSLSITLLSALSIGKSIEVVITQMLCEYEQKKEKEKKNSSSNNNNKNNDQAAVGTNKNASTTAATTTTTAPPVHPESFYAARRDAVTHVIPFSFFLAATIYAAIQYYYNPNENTNSNSSNGYGSEYNTNNTNNNATITSLTTNATIDTVQQQQDEQHRLLAGYATGDETTQHSNSDNTTAWLLLSGFIANIIFGFFVFWIRLAKTVNRHEFSVPINVDHIIHRYGEWIMLMMGESVLSLMIVDMEESGGYIGTFVCGVLSIVFLQFLHFQSQPHDPDKHAFRRHIRSGFSFVTIMQVYSAALIILGSTYKMFLYEYVYANIQETSKAVAAASTADEDHRTLSFINNQFQFQQQYRYDNNQQKNQQLLLSRLLAGGNAEDDPALRFDTVSRQQRIAYFFSFSLALVFLCLDGFALSHKGYVARRDECLQSKFKKIGGIILVSGRLIVIIFVGTVSQYIINPSVLAGIGLGSIIVQLILRAIGSYIFFPTEEDDHNKNNNNNDNSNNTKQQQQQQQGHLALPDVSASQH